MLDTLLIVIVFVLSYFSLVRKSGKDRQARLLDRLEKYLDRVAPEVQEESAEEEEDNEEEEGEEDGDNEEREDPLSLLSKAFLESTTGDSKDTEKLVQASRELLKENLGALMNQEGQKEFAKLFGQLTEFVKL